MNSKYLTLVGALALSSAAYAGADLDPYDHNEGGFSIAEELANSMTEIVVDDDGMLNEEEVREHFDAAVLLEFDEDS